MILDVENFQSEKLFSDFLEFFLEPKTDITFLNKRWWYFVETFIELPIFNEYENLINDMLEKSQYKKLAEFILVKTPRSTILSEIEEAFNCLDYFNKVEVCDKYLIPYRYFVDEYDYYSLNRSSFA